MSLIYTHPYLYELSLRMLYRRHYHERLQAVAEQIPEGSSVTDICAGDCALYRYALRERMVRYIACDANARFIRWAQRREITAVRIDVRSHDIPPADCIVMMGSLYQFIPRHTELLTKWMHAARKKFILTEPIRNFAQSRWSVVRRIGQAVNQLQGQSFTQRLDWDTLYPLLHNLGFQTITRIAGDRELLGVYTMQG